MPGTVRARAHYLEPWSKILGRAGYPPEEATAAALQVLPDTLRYPLGPRPDTKVH